MKIFIMAEGIWTDEFMVYARGCVDFCCPDVNGEHVQQFSRTRQQTVMNLSNWAPLREHLESQQ